MPKENRRAQSAVAAREEIAERLDSAQDHFDDLKESVQERVQQAKKIARQKAKEVQEYAEENPWHVTAAGLVAGFILGALIFRRRD